MIDLTKVTHTRAGYKVTNARYYPMNDCSCKIIANIEMEGKVEPDTFYDDGSYYLARETELDLVEGKQEPIRHQEEEIDVISDLLESFAFSLSVCLEELNRIKIEKEE